MSIPDFHNKIKSNIAIDSSTIIVALVIIIVAIGSFVLGRISVSEKINSDKEKVTIITDTVNNEKSVKSSLESTPQIGTQNGNYVASKSGKIYYTLSCGGAKRIAEKNKIYFNTKEGAEKAGYLESKSCK